MKKKISNKKIVYFSIYIIDIILIIFFAKKNYANFITVGNVKDYYIGGSTKNLIFGKNYITLITTILTTTYILSINKFLFHKKNDLKTIALITLSLLIINCILFYTFTNKIY